MDLSYTEIVKKFSEKDLKALQEAIYKDYGVKLRDEDLYDAAFNLVGFFETLIKMDQEDKAKKLTTKEGKKENV